MELLGCVVTLCLLVEAVHFPSSVSHSGKFEPKEGVMEDPALWQVGQKCQAGVRKVGEVVVPEEKNTHTCSVRSGAGKNSSGLHKLTWPKRWGSSSESPLPPAPVVVEAQSWFFN